MIAKFRSGSRGHRRVSVDRQAKRTELEKRLQKTDGDAVFQVRF